MTPNQIPQAVRVIGLDVAVIQLRSAAALRRLEDSLPGFPTGSDGGGSSDAGSITERLALAGTDRARADLARLLQLVDQMQRSSRDAAALCDAWARGHIGPAIAARQTDDIWCPNCVKHKAMNPKAKDRSLCSWCEDTQQEYGCLPNAELYRLRGIYKRLTAEQYEKALGAKRRAA